MADVDLATALGMFKDGANQLMLSRAIDGANQQVQQIKASEANEQQQRAQIQGISNQLTAHMAMLGTPATTMQAVAGAIGPKQYADANDMNKDALLTGNKNLASQAEDQQAFEQTPEYKIEVIKAKYANMNPLAAMKFQEAKDEFTTRQFKAYGEDLDASKASSRTSFGKWQNVADNGSRMQAILGNPNAPKTPQELQLAADSLGQMVKGSALTEGDQKTLHAAGLKITAAQEAAKLTGGPVSVDLSDWSKLYTSVAQREDENAKSNMVDDLMQKINNKQSLANRDPKQFALTTAAALQRQGLNVDPRTITVDKENGVYIPELTPFLDAANQAPKQIKDALRDANGPAGVARQQAIANLAKLGIAPDANPKEAIKTAQRKIKLIPFGQ